MKTIYRCVVCGSYTESRRHCGEVCRPFLDGRRRLMLSKLISFLLRHDPSSAGLKMDGYGWVSIAELVKALRRFGGIGSYMGG